MTEGHGLSRWRFMNHMLAKSNNWCKKVQRELENWCKKLQDKILKRRDKKTLRELEKLRLDIITDVLTLRTSLESLASYAYFDDAPYAQKILMNLEQELKVILASYRVALKKEP